MSTRLATAVAGAGASLAITGALVLCSAGTASAAPLTNPAPTSSTSSPSVTPAAFAQPSLLHQCHRVWHGRGWWWDHGRRRWHPGFFVCG